MVKPRVKISLTPEMMSVLEELARQKETTKSKVIEAYLKRVSNRVKRRQREVA